MGMNEINKKKPTGDREGRARWGEARSGECDNTEIKKGHSVGGKAAQEEDQEVCPQEVIVTMTRETYGNRS